MPEIITHHTNGVSGLLQRGALSLFRVFRTFCSCYGLVIIAISLFAVIANDLQYFRQGQITLNQGLFCLGFLLSLIPGFWGWAIFIALIPLTSNLSAQLHAYLDIEIVALPASGFDLVGGFLLGSFAIILSKYFLQRAAKQNKQLTGSLFQRFSRFCESNMPWQIGFLLFFISIEVGLSLARNLYQSAAVTSTIGVLFNLSHFRPIPWRSDFMPLADLIAYGMAAALMVVCLLRLRDNPYRSEYLIRPLLFSLLLSVLLAGAQSLTGLGLPADRQFFRMDILGSAAIGFHPDIHSYAGFILLGCVGLWGYFLSRKSIFESRILLAIIALSWLGLVFSKSRSSLLIALIAVLLYFSIQAYKQCTPRIFWGRAILGLVTLCIGVPLCLYFFKPEYLYLITDLVHQIFSKNNQLLSTATQEFGGRPEIFKAALHMFSAFPWMGIGQGEFYRQSSNEGFSHSFLLGAWGGENAHNYFLQTLAETGLIGVAVFSFALLAPLFLSPKKSDFRVGLIALGSLFLGNLYSHAFLVRENLLLGALFLALLYSYIPSVSLSSGRSQIRPPKSPISNKAILCLIISIGCITSFGVYEVYKSFGKEPFRFGSECFVNRPLTKDSWTSGLFMVRMPKGSSEVVVSLEPIRSDISAERPLRYGAEIVNRRIETISSVKGEWNSSNKVELRIARPLDSADTSPREDSFILSLGGCFIPRNLGVSLDDRLLGVRILSISHY
jgi:O-antigen ligase